MVELPKKIKLKRERERLDALARQKGFDSFDVLLYELYVVQKTPLKELQKMLFTPMWTLRRRMDAIGITMRSRGGRNRVRTEITPELVDEVTKDGVQAVADRMGVDAAALRVRLKKWFDDHKSS